MILARTSPTAVTPLIGISTYREDARWGAWHQTADLLHVEYADAVAAAGGIPVLLPPARPDPVAAATVVARLDGLIIAGGADLDPGLYGERPHSRTANWRPDRDAWELALIAGADESNLPTLGICRGMQLMAVAAGGALTQHMPDVVGHEEHNPGGPEFGLSIVDTQSGSRVAAMVGDRALVPCHHHQSVREHPGFHASGWSADGTVEAMEAPGARFCVAVQWHPEMHRRSPDASDGGPVFAAVVEAARSYRRDPSGTRGRVR
jgi:putative glutamine amidotransferase